MPLLSSASGGTPTGPPPASAPSSVPLQVAYIDPDGTGWEWSDELQGTIVTSVTGIGSPPSVPTSLALPTGDLLTQSVAPGARQVVIGLYVYDDDQSAFLTRLDALARALSNERAGLPAPATIVIRRPGGTSRQVQVICTSGPEQPDTDSTIDAYQAWTTYGLTFSPVAPYWEDLQDTIQTFRTAGEGGGIPPLLPIGLNPSVVLGETSIVNDGDADAWPVWTITGPGTPTISNVTTGRSFSIDAALVTGEVITVDTRPGHVSAIDGTGADRWSDLVKTSPRDLWQLVPRRNDLDLEMLDATAGTSIQLSYRRRWLRA